MNPVNSIFLDTEVFDSYNYAYDSPTMQALSKACKEAEINLLIPDPTEKEILRHIRDRSNSAVLQLRAMRTKAPFIAEWENFPSKEFHKFDAISVANIGINQWRIFKKSLNGERLGYDGLNLAEIMKWYDQKIAPFAKGKKSKEFPDAIAIAILSHYAKLNSKFIAVVSRDPDLKKSCDRYTSLLYFFSIRSLTESILERKSSVEKFRKPIENDAGPVEVAIEEAAHIISVSHSTLDLEAELGEVLGASLIDYSIIAIGQHECTIAFEAEVEFNVHLDTNDSAWAIHYGDITQDYDLYSTFTGVATVKYSEDLKSLIEVPKVEFDDPEYDFDLDPAE